MIALDAPAKVNLALHVTGRRDDGYHLLDSVVVFVDVCDRIELDAAATLNLSVTGPRAPGVPTDRRNLVWQAAEWLGPGRGAAITLEKHLPHAGGIGGGSADAAATLQGLSRLWRVPLPSPGSVLCLGADVPVCLYGRPARMRGVGEILDPLPAFPTVWLVLVNPGIEVPTGAVFSSLDRVDNAPLPTPDWSDVPSLTDYLSATRNDLEGPACALVPQIGEVVAGLQAQPGCLMARMSGSGATCFGLFADEGAALDAKVTLSTERPDWWVASGQVRRDERPS